LNLDVIMGIITIIGIIMVIFKILYATSGISYKLSKWLLLGFGLIILFWGMYNMVGKTFGLWDPLSLDAYLESIFGPLLDLLDRIRSWFFEWLDKAFQVIIYV